MELKDTSRKFASKGKPVNQTEQLQQQRQTRYPKSKQNAIAVNTSRNSHDEESADVDYTYESRNTFKSKTKRAGHIFLGATVDIID